VVALLLLITYKADPLAHAPFDVIETSELASAKVRRGPQSSKISPAKQAAIESFGVRIFFMDLHERSAR
jgi:hypothetical protein